MEVKLDGTRFRLIVSPLFRPRKNVLSRVFESVLSRALICALSFSLRCLRRNARAQVPNAAREASSERTGGIRERAWDKAEEHQCLKFEEL